MYKNRIIELFFVYLVLVILIICSYCGYLLADWVWWSDLDFQNNISKPNTNPVPIFYAYQFFGFLYFIFGVAGVLLSLAIICFVFSTLRRILSNNSRNTYNRNTYCCCCCTIICVQGSITVQV